MKKFIPFIFITITLGLTGVKFAIAAETPATEGTVYTLEQQ